MKNQIAARLVPALTRPPRLTRRDIAFTIIPALLWLGAIYARPYVITPKCAKEPTLCSAASVPLIDRVALGIENSEADLLSYHSQNLSGILAVSVPALWTLSRLGLGQISGAVALVAMGTDLVLFTETATWNGMLGESVRVLTQRARPFVYADPARLGNNPAHYTSFYSGHTSYAGAVMTALFLILLSRGMPLGGLLFWAAAAEVLTFATGIFRILAGRHFPTDVLTAAVVGPLIALMVALVHRRKSP